MAVLALMLGLGGALTIHRMVEAVHDRLLDASARAIADTLQVDRGSISLDLPPAAFGMLENAERDNVYYNVVGPGGLITGYGELASRPAAKLDGPTFRYDDVRGRRVRVVAESRRLPRIAGPITVQVAETLDARELLTRRLLLALGALELSLLLLTALLVPVAVRWGLRPLTRIQAAADGRGGGGDFTALPQDQAPAELRSLIGAFNALLFRLETATTGVRRFAADASHQLRTPLAVMRTHIGVLRDHVVDSADARAALADLDSGAERLQRLLEQLLSLSRAEADRDVPLVDVNLQALVREVAADHGPRAVAAGLELQFDAPDEPVVVRTDPVLAAEIVANLLDNAIRYTEPGCEVRLTIAARPGWAQIIVEDDGPGVPPEERDRILQRFHRMPQHVDKPGSGLGLAIVEGLATQLGARFELQHPPRGLRALLSLPRGGDVQETP